METFLPRDIIYIDLGNSIGHELERKRPCVIIKSFPEIRMALIVPLSHGKPNNLYTNVTLEYNPNSKDKEKSFALCHQIRSISYDRILKKFNTLSERDFKKIRFTIADFLED